MSTILNNASSLTQTHPIHDAALTQTPTTTHPLLPPTQLLPTQRTMSSPSVASTVQLFDSLGNPAQTQTRKPPQTSQLDRMEALLSSVLEQVRAVQQNTSQHAEAINNHSTTLANHSTSLATLLDTQSKQQEEINRLKDSNTNLSKDILDHTVRIAQLEDTVAKLVTTTSNLTSDSQLLQTTNHNLETLQQQVTTQGEQIDTLYNDPPNNSAELVQQKVQEHINILNTQQFWQRELDRSSNQLVFKNLKKTPITTNMHPKDIFTSNILSPMGLNTEDESKATPISVFDANKGKEAANNHLLICTFSSLDAISIIKQNAKKIPKQVKFCARVPLQYTATMNKFLKTQGKIRLLKDTNGISLAKSRITTNKGYLILEKSDRVGEDFSRFYPIRSFIPQSAEGIPLTTPPPMQKPTP